MPRVGLSPAGVVDAAIAIVDESGPGSSPCRPSPDARASRRRRSTSTSATWPSCAAS
ncbi:hypothetical protein ACFQHO_27340 [Actinomadura yumaensis]|uniref:hypothetical protein n=1 Tax=Actinomadura yumaensis TaxID=111807 RepID=UPI00360F6D2B